VPKGALQRLHRQKFVFLALFGLMFPQRRCNEKIIYAYVLFQDNSNEDVTDEKLNGVNNNNNKVISDSCSNNSISENDQFLAAERNEIISSPDSTTNTKQNGVHHTV